MHFHSHRNSVNEEQANWEAILSHLNLGMDRGLGGHWLIYVAEYPPITRPFSYSLRHKLRLPSHSSAEWARNYRKQHPERVRAAKRRYYLKTRNASHL